MANLGYPTYLMTILGVAKLLGVIAQLMTGFTFDMLGAAASHAFVGDSPAEIVTPLVALALAITSYCLRQPTRRLRIAQI